MKLLDLIDYLVTPVKSKSTCLGQGLSEDDIEARSLSIYMVNCLGLESDIQLFNFGETNGNIEFQQEGVNYIYMLEIDLAIDLLASDFSLKNKKVTNQDRANRLLDYAIYDA